MRSDDGFPTSGGGPLEGMRVLELASEHAAFAGKLLGDLGAEVLLVEPPGGHPTRHIPPFVDDRDDGSGDRSLWFWHYNTSKANVPVDLESGAGADAFRALVAHAHIVLEAEPVGRLAGLGLDEADLRRAEPSLVWVSMTPYGRDDPRSAEPVADLTLLAGGGLAWMCGYDEPGLPPMASLGNQAYQTASIWAVLGALVAARVARTTGEGQHVDVSMHASVNVTTEHGSQWWLVAGKEVVRQRGRHASQSPTDPVLHPAADGGEVHTGFPPHRGKDLEALVAWIDDLGLRSRFPMVVLLEMAIASDGIDLARLREDELVQEQYRAARDGLIVVASHLSAYEFFIQSQERGFATGAIFSPEEAMADPHLVERGFPVPIDHPLLGRSVPHPGVPIRFTASPGTVRRAPSLGEVIAPDAAGARP